MMKKILTVVLLSFLALEAGARWKHTLFDRGRTDYCIVVGGDASETVRFAAEELQTWIRKAGGVTIPIRESAAVARRKRCLVVGEALPGDPCAGGTDAFCWRSDGGNVHLWGGSDRGTLYSVYSFLSENLGCRWYTGSISVAPHCESWGFDTLDHSESPAFRIRDNFWFDAFDPLWAARNRSTHVGGPLAGKLGGGEAILGCHTLGNNYITQEKYLDSHPEYFSLIDGVRSREYVQVCLSNPEVLQIVIDGVRAQMRENPGIRIFDVSQNDNSEVCQCEGCRALAARFGGHESGSMLWFVNQVADAVRDEFPDNFVCTFAYQYTRSVPENIKPRDNVMIRLCAVEECQLHDIDSCGPNRSFLHDLQEWSRIAPRLAIWDYVGSYRHYLAPMPNLRTFQSRIRAFRDYGAVSVMPQGNFQSRGSIFDELKAYVTSKLLWNPDCDVTAAEDDFLNGVFGPAAPAIREYLEYERSAIIRPDKHETGFLEIDSDFYPDGFEARGREILKKAYAAVRGDSVLTSRVGRAELPLCYLQLARNPRVGVETGALDLLTRVAAGSGVTHFREGEELARMDVFLQDMKTAHLMAADPADYGDVKLEAPGMYFHLKKADTDGVRLVGRAFKGWNGRTSIYIYVYPEAGGHPKACYRVSGHVTPGAVCRAYSDAGWIQGEVEMSGFDPDADYVIAVSDVSPEKIEYRIIPLPVRVPVGQETDVPFD